LYLGIRRQHVGKLAPGIDAARHHLTLQEEKESRLLVVSWVLTVVMAVK